MGRVNWQIQDDTAELLERIDLMATIGVDPTQPMAERLAAIDEVLMWMGQGGTWRALRRVQNRRRHAAARERRETERTWRQFEQLEEDYFDAADVMDVRFHDSAGDDSKPF